MNERIQKLIEQAGVLKEYTFVNGATVWKTDPSIEKFAELIVQECVKQCTEIVLKEDGIASLHPGQQSFASYRAGAIACSNRLKYYFGVK
jgi:hypothetical protein